MTASNHIAVASATINNGSAALSIVGDLTGWLVPGYRFGSQDGNYWQIIDSVGTYSGGSTSVTLAENWGGTNLSGAPAQIEIVTEGVTLAAKVVTLINLLGNGILQSFSSVGWQDGDRSKFSNGSWVRQTISDLLADLVASGAPTKTQENTTNATLQSPWTNYGNGYKTCSFYKDQFGRVHVSFVVKDGSTTSSGIIFNLPSGYRPVELEQFAVALCNDSTCTAVQVRPDGRVEVAIGAGITAAYLSASFSFRAA